MLQGPQGGENRDAYLSCRVFRRRYEHRFVLGQLQVADRFRVIVNLANDFAVLIEKMPPQQENVCGI